MQLPPRYTAAMIMIRLETLNDAVEAGCLMNVRPPSPKGACLVLRPPCGERPSSLSSRLPQRCRLQSEASAAAPTA